MASKKNYYIKSIIKSLNILNLFSESRQELSISEISKALDLGLSTTYRLLSTLKYKNYIEQNPHNLKYKLGYAFLNKAFLVSHNEADIIKKSVSYLENLRDFTKESVSLAVLDGVNIVYIAKADSYELLRTNIEIGKKMPAYNTALGRVLLAYLSPEQFNRLFSKDNLLISAPCSNLNISEFKQYLEKVKGEGIALDNEECIPGIRCIAAPIVDVNGEISTAISISGPKTRFSIKKINLWKKELIRTAKEISFKNQ